MGSPDFEVIKEIPGYKVILKAVLKSQIQQLINQLAADTEEESIILTASVADGTLSNLGSHSGKSFLDGHEDVKSQFLGFCLKAHHQKAQQGKLKRQEARQQGKLEKQKATQQEILERWKAIPPFCGFYSGPPRFPCTTKSPRSMSPRSFLMTRGPHIDQIRSSSVRHEPYPAIITQNRTSDFDQQSLGGKLQDAQIIKVEPYCVDDETSNQSDLNITAQNAHGSSQPSSPSEASAASSQMKNESLDQDDVTLLGSSISIIHSGIQPEGPSLGLDMHLSNLIKDEQCSQTFSSGDVDTYVNIKLQPISDSKMDLNIMSVEHCKKMSYADWAPNVSMAMNFDSSGVMNYGPSHAMIDQPGTHATRHGYKTTPMTSAERQRKYRQNRDQDPKKRELYLQKEREKYQKYKTTGKMKLVRDMTEKERRSARDRWRTLKRKSREKEAVTFLKPTASSEQLNQPDEITKTLKSEWIETD